MLTLVVLGCVLGGGPETSVSFKYIHSVRACTRMARAQCK